MKHQKVRILEIFIDQLICSDIPPLVDAFSSGSLSDVDAVDVCQRSSNPSLTGESVLSLLHVLKPKLRVVDLIDWSFWKNILQYESLTHLLLLHIYLFFKIHCIISQNYRSF